jgi:tRNA U34 5-methylaminomethyl-2-thiouridine-forming methyltransferase MnmC
MRKIRTADGSFTFHSSEHDENYKSASGALTESDKKYALVCEIDKRSSVDILDICFGLGYNSAAALDRFSGSRISIVGLENYQGIIDEIVRLGDEYPFRCREMMQRVAKEGKYSDGKVEINLVMGDARENIQKLQNESFDVVFLDPFSPAKCPELWTAEFFSQIYRVMRPGGMLATYSCARPVRDNLKSAGFSVRDGPTIGRRGPATVAEKAEHISQ